MRYLFILTVFLLMLPVTAKSQGDPRGSQTAYSEWVKQLEWRQVKGHLDNLDSLGKVKLAHPTNPGEDNGQIILDALYRRSTKTERELLAPENEDRSKFADFLSRPGTGMMKLIRDFGCDEYSTAAFNDKLCKEFSMPGGGSAFSFRETDYQFWKLADLLYDGRSFIAFGQMSLGLMVDLGDVPIQNVQMDSKGMSYLTSLAPKGEIAEATKQNAVLADGIADNGFTYKKFLPVVVGDTYAIRSVAYRGRVAREHYELKYNELDFDRRKDVIAVFRVVRKDFNGTVTILWKILQAKQSPELKTRK